MRIASRSISFGAATVLGLVALAGCSGGKPPLSDTHGSLFIDDELTLHANGHPNAVVTRDGDLLINDTPVQLDAMQRTLLLAYYRQIDALARQGAAMGTQGARLGVNAAIEALKGVVGGDTDGIGAKVEAQAEQIEQQALKICDSLVTVKAAQDALVAAVPLFQPYADMSEQEIADCRS